MQPVLQTNVHRWWLKERKEMDGRREDDRVLILFSVYKLSSRPDHLHIHYHGWDSIIVLCGNTDLFCLPFVILISCATDSPFLITPATKLKTMVQCNAIGNYSLLVRLKSLCTFSFCVLVQVCFTEPSFRVGRPYPAGQLITSRSSIHVSWQRRLAATFWTL